VGHNKVYLVANIQLQLLKFAFCYCVLLRHQSRCSRPKMVLKWFWICLKTIQIVCRYIRVGTVNKRVIAGWRSRWPLTRESLLDCSAHISASVAALNSRWNTTRWWLVDDRSLPLPGADAQCRHDGPFLYRPATTITQSTTVPVSRRAVIVWICHWSLT